MYSVQLQEAGKVYDMYVMYMYGVLIMIFMPRIVGIGSSEGVKACHS